MLKNLFDYQDSLAVLNNDGSLQDKLTSIHEVITTTFEFIDRIAIAVYEHDTDELKTFVASCHGENILRHYRAYLKDSPSLVEILQKGRPRVVNNLNIFSAGQHAHTRRIAEMKFAASYTMPVYQHGSFFGFVFFNSIRPDVFEQNVLHQMDLFGHMISLMVMNELSSAYAMTAALKTTGDIVQQRDPETGSHIDRMSRYARLIATQLADKYNLSDEYIEKITMFSPLHDIGKVGIPDSILLKAGQLTDNEFETMKSHTVMGREMIDRLLNNFGFAGFQYAEVLRNIAEYHHEAINGSGYPKGLEGNEIPLEARIVAVADIFDALTSQRPYKEAWSNERAFDMLKKLVGSKLDEDCVCVLMDNLAEIESIQKQFSEDPFG
jgi:HD-GYP domain-containing protein (c-di-GMP phosphodiesterase class II)